MLSRLETKQKSYFTLIKSLTVADLVQSHWCSLCSIYVSQRTLCKSHYCWFYWSTTVVCHMRCPLFFDYVGSGTLSPIMRPLYYVNWCRRRNNVWRLTIIWALPLVEVVLAVMGYIQIFISKWHITPFLVMMYVCLLVVCVVYLLIYRKVRKQQRQEDRLNREDKFRYKTLSTTVMILLILLFFGHLVWYAGSLSVNYKVLVILRYPNSSMTCLNCICDPLIYSLRLSNVQKIWRRSFQCCFKEGSMHSEVTNQQVQWAKLFPGTSIIYAYEHVMPRYSDRQLTFKARICFVNINNCHDITNCLNEAKLYSG